MRIGSDRNFGKIDMKNKLIRSIFVLVCFQAVLTFDTWAQIKAERISFSIPKTLFFTDEKIWISGTVQGEESFENSKVFYAELIDQEHRSWAIGKFPIEEGKVFNYLELPASIPSGNYLLRVFTRISPYLDLESGMSQQLVTILNPVLPPSIGKNNIKYAEQSYKGIDPVAISVTEIEKSKDFQISVNTQFQDAIQSIKLSIANPYLGQTSRLSSKIIYESMADSTFLPELFGHIIHGKLIGVPVDTTKTYFLSAHGAQSALYTDRPDDSGNLFFDLGGFKHWDHVLVQVEDGSNLNAFEIQAPSPKTKFKSDFKIPELRISREDADFLQKVKLASALEPYFTQVYQNDSMNVVVGFVADQTYMLDDYTRFETVETIVKEYVPNVSVRRKDKLKKFRVINVEASYLFEGNPLMMVDALPIFNSDLLANFNPKFFRKLEILNREFYLNDRKYDGVLNFSSYQNDFGLFPIPNEVLYQSYSGLNPYIQLEKPIYSSPNNEKSMPDYRSVLFWYQKGIDPLGLSFNANTSEMTGQFILEVELKDMSGDLKVWKKTIQVN
jgi:hypothetical protein